jgi:hypothetical protein
MMGMISNFKTTEIVKANSYSNTCKDILTC